jgi:hypothetical protein
MPGCKIQFSTQRREEGSAGVSPAALGDPPDAKTTNYFLKKTNPSVSIGIAPIDQLCNHKTNNRFAASAAVQLETGNFIQRTAFEARPLGRA